MNGDATFLLNSSMSHRFYARTPLFLVPSTMSLGPGPHRHLGLFFERLMSGRNPVDFSKASQNKAGRCRTISAIVRRLTRRCSRTGASVAALPLRPPLNGSIVGRTAQEDRSQRIGISWATSQPRCLRAG